MLVGMAGLALVSGGTRVDPRTPPALPGQPPPFLGTAVVGDGRLAAAVDAYGDVAGIWAPGPAGTALVENPSERQAAGSVDVRAGIVPRLRIGGGPALPPWRADSVSQSYLPGTNVVRTVARFGRTRMTVTTAAEGSRLAMTVAVRGGAGAEPSVAVATAPELRCRRARSPGQLDLLCRVGRAVPDSVDADSMITTAAAANRRWLARARPLGGKAPRWAIEMYERGLLAMRALTDRNGAVAAGARDGWAYVWPRDAGAVALAFVAAGYRGEARRVARFLAGLDLDAAARFDGGGEPVPGRAAQGDAAGWVAAAARAAGLPPPSQGPPWRDRADYWESDPGDHLGNAVASVGGVSDSGGAYDPAKSGTPEARVVLGRRFGGGGGLVRRAGDPDSGLDSAAAWAVRPFASPALFPAARRTLHRLAGGRTAFGITPGEGWNGGEDPWSAPTAWTAWGLAALAAEARAGGDRRDRRAAQALLGALRRSATPAGALPERVDARSGVPRSTTPLAWSHAFAVLALRELWPDLSSADGGEAGKAR